jgi:hypothetical protein
VATRVPTRAEGEGLQQTRSGGLSRQGGVTCRGSGGTTEAVLLSSTDVHTRPGRSRYGQTRVEAQPESRISAPPTAHACPRAVWRDASGRLSLGCIPRRRGFSASRLELQALRPLCNHYCPVPSPLLEATRYQEHSVREDRLPPALVDTIEDSHIEETGLILHRDEHNGDA